MPTASSICQTVMSGRISARRTCWRTVSPHHRHLQSTRAPPAHSAFRPLTLSRTRFVHHRCTTDGNVRFAVVFVPPKIKIQKAAPGEGSGSEADQPLDGSSGLMRPARQRGTLGQVVPRGSRLPESRTCVRNKFLRGGMSPRANKILLAQSPTGSPSDHHGSLSPSPPIRQVQPGTTDRSSFLSVLLVGLSINNSKKKCPAGQGRMYDENGERKDKPTVYDGGKGRYQQGSLLDSTSSSLRATASSSCTSWQLGGEEGICNKFVQSSGVTSGCPAGVTRSALGLVDERSVRSSSGTTSRPPCTSTPIPPRSRSPPR